MKKIVLLLLVSTIVMGSYGQESPCPKTITVNFTVAIDDFKWCQGAIPVPQKWAVGDKIKFFFNTPTQPTVALAVQDIDGNRGTFKGAITHCMSNSGEAVAVSPATLMVPNNRFEVPTIDFVYPATQIQKGSSTDHLLSSDVMVAVGPDTLPLSGDACRIKLQMEHLGSMVQFNVINTDSRATYTLRSIRLSETGGDTLLLSHVQFTATAFAEYRQLVGIQGSGRDMELILDHGQSMAKGDSTCCYMMVPPQKKRTAGSRLCVTFTVADEHNQEWVGSYAAPIVEPLEAGCGYRFNIEIEPSKLTPAIP